MAINPDVAFPGKTAGVSAEYPYGKARDVSAPGDGTGTPLRAAWVNDWFGFQQAVLEEAGITPSGIPDSALSSQLLDGLKQLGGDSNKVKVFTSPEEATVGVSGDFSSITSALSHFSTRYPSAAIKTPSAKIRLLAGFIMAEQVVLAGRDLGWVTIVSDDASVPISRDALSVPYYGHKAAFTFAEQATGPQIGCLFNMTAGAPGLLNDNHFLYVTRGSRGRIASGCGCTGAGGNGVFCQFASNVDAEGCVVYGSKIDNFQAVNASTINAFGAVAHSAGRRSAYATRVSRINVRQAQLYGAAEHGCYAVHASQINCLSANITGCGGNAVYAWNGSVVAAYDADASDCAEYAFAAAHGSTINCHDAKANNSKRGAWAYDASTINAHSMSATSCTETGAHADNGSVINATSATFSGSAIGVGAFNGSKVVFDNGVASGCPSIGANALVGSHISARSADLSDAGAYAIRAQESAVYADLANCQGAGTRAIQLDHGCHGSLRGANVNGSAGRGLSIFNGCNINASEIIASACVGNGVSADRGCTLNIDSAQLGATAATGLRFDRGCTVNATGATGFVPVAPNTPSAAGIMYA